MVSFLKIRLYIFLVSVVCAIFLSQCQQSKPEEPEKTEKGASCSTKKPLNPNGDSELALLMREMYDSSASLKVSIEKGILPSDFPKQFLKIHSAKPTDPTVKTEAFEALAKDYLSGLKNLYASPKEELTKNYNLSVQKCINCHEAFCPGPIQKIVRLKFAE